MRNITDELQRKTGVRITYKIFRKKLSYQKFLANSVYSNWLCCRLQTLAVGRMAHKMGFAP